MSFRVSQSAGGGWIVRTPTGVRFESGAVPSCLSPGAKALATAACKGSREAIRGLGARGPMPARAGAEACQLAKRPTCGATKCLDVPTLNRLLDNVKGRAQGPWALWARTLEADAMQKGVACSKISPPKCLNSEQQKLLAYYKKYGWKGPDPEMNGKVWVTRAQTPSFFKRPPCAVVLPSMPKRRTPSQTVHLTPVVRRPAPPPPMRIAAQRVSTKPKPPPKRPRLPELCADPIWNGRGQRYCAGLSVPARAGLQAALLCKSGRDRCVVLTYLKNQGYLSSRGVSALKACKPCPKPEREGARISPKLTPKLSPSTPTQPKSPEAPAPILAPPTPAVVVAPTPTPAAPAPSPEAPAPVLAPTPEVPTAPSPEVTEPVVAPEPPGPGAETYPTEPGGEGGEESKPFPWLLVAVAVGGGYYLYKRSKKGKRAHA